MGHAKEWPGGASWGRDASGPTPSSCGSLGVVRPKTRRGEAKEGAKERAPHWPSRASRRRSAGRRRARRGSDLRGRSRDARARARRHDGLRRAHRVHLLLLRVLGADDGGDNEGGLAVSRVPHLRVPRAVVDHCSGKSLWATAGHVRGAQAGERREVRTCMARRSAAARSLSRRSSLAART